MVLNLFRTDYVVLVEFSCHLYSVRHQARTGRRYESETNKQYPDGFFASVLLRIRSSLDQKPEYGIDEPTNRFKNIFTDVIT